MDDGTDPAQYFDIGYGCPVQVSSVHPNSRPPHFLRPAMHRGDHFFCTNIEANPSITVDLGATRPVKRVRVFNHERDSARAVPLSVQISTDGEEFREIALIGFRFGGRRNGPPLVLDFQPRIAIRYLKLIVKGRSILHLDYVEISLLVPQPEFGRLRDLRSDGPRIMADYRHHDSYGFAWTFTCTLAAVIAARHAGITVKSIDYSRAMLPFKDDPADDLHARLFEPPAPGPEELPMQRLEFERHGIYAKYSLADIKPYIDVYFRPSAAVLAFERQLVESYGIDPGMTIALLYRGTDKASEVKPAPIEAYIAAAQALLLQHPGLRMVIQSDQAQAVAAVLEAIPGAVAFKELPTTSGNVVMHRLRIEEEFAISRSIFSVRLLAVMHLLSRCRFVVSHTGNVGAWVALFRGSGAGFYQFDAGQVLRDPDGVAVDPASLRPA